MIKKTVRWVCGLVFVVILSIPAFADQSIGYRQYFNEGVKAFKEHDDQKALRCFKIAQIYDPADKELKRYLSVLDQRGVILELNPSRLPPSETIGYRYYFSGGIKAFQAHDDKKAIRYFKIALIFNSASKDAERYLRILIQRQGLSFLPENPLELYTPPAQQVIAQPQPYTPPIQPQPSANIPQAVPMVPAPEVITQTQASTPPSVMPQSVVYIPGQKPKQAPIELQMDQITKGKIKPILTIVLNSSVILVSRNIKNFLIVNENFIGVRILDQDHIEIDALKIGTTFLHIWDDFGRHTFYIEVVFPKFPNSSGMSQSMSGIQHSQPFNAVYSNDWTTYYSGKNIPNIKRQEYDFNQTLAITGETPYGFFDTSGSYSYVDSFSDFDTYTIGLSQIPLAGTSNFDLRGFDATRYLSPLTMPGTTLRGAFADVDLLGDTLGLSVSHGQEQVTEGFVNIGADQFTDSYIDAAKLTLFPKSTTDRYSFNFATAYGPDRPNYLTDHVYSVEGQHAFNDNLTLHAEEATDSTHDATLASLQWQEGAFNTGLHFRNIDKDYSTISTLPAYQGETGADWTTQADFQNIKEETFFEFYQDRLDAPSNDTGALNYDGNGVIRADISKDLSSNTYFTFQSNPEDTSYTRNLGLEERLSRSFDVWNSLKGSVFAGPAYQNSYVPGSKISDYNREYVVAGFELPITTHVSAYVNYEYDWVQQPSPGDNSNPSVINTGLQYVREITPKISFNSQVDYHDEQGVTASNYNIFPGEESIILSSGINFNPMQDVTIFGDLSASQVLYHTNNPSSDDFEAHLGMRIAFGGAVYWDPLGTVSGIVFKDRNGDGHFAAGDEGIPGVKVKVGDKEAVTDKNGRYSIKIRAKGVDVTPVLDTVPGGLLFSTPQTLNVRIFQGRISRADFGLSSQTGIYGIVFVSRNGSNVPNDGDQFVGKVKVILDGKIINKSDSHGAFYFRKVSPGEHIISIDINTLALNMVPLVKLENKIDVTEGTNYSFNIPVQIKEAQGDQN